MKITSPEDKHKRYDAALLKRMVPIAILSIIFLNLDVLTGGIFFRDSYLILGTFIVFSFLYVLICIVFRYHLFLMIIGGMIVCMLGLSFMLFFMSLRYLPKLSLIQIVIIVTFITILQVLYWKYTIKSPKADSSESNYRWKQLLLMAITAFVCIYALQRVNLYLHSYIREERKVGRYYYQEYVTIISRKGSTIETVRQFYQCNKLKLNCVEIDFAKWWFAK